MRDKFEEKEEIENNIEKGKKANRREFVKLVNQLMLKMEASLISEGSDGYRNLTDFGERIINEIIENDKYVSNEKEVNNNECFTIGMLQGQYSVTYSYEKEMDCDLEWEQYLDIEYLDSDRVKLIVRERDYDETEEDEHIESQYDSASAIISIKELQDFSDSLPGLYSHLPEKMIEKGQFFDDNGRFSKREIKEFMKLKYIPGTFCDISIGAGHDNYGNVYINIPNGIATELTADMFEQYKEKLVELTIPFSVKNIEKETFYNCPNLKKVVMCESIGEQNVSELFEKCPNLDNILVVPKDAEKYLGKYGYLRIGESYRSKENGEISKEGTYVYGENDEQYKLMEIPNIKHSISEISDTVSDRRPENINKTISEISEAMRDIPKDNDKTKDE